MKLLNFIKTYGFVLFIIVITTVVMVKCTGNPNQSAKPDNSGQKLQS